MHDKLYCDEMVGSSSSWSPVTGPLVNVDMEVSRTSEHSESLRKCGEYHIYELAYDRRRQLQRGSGR